MSAHQAICHLAEALRVFLGEAPTPPRADTWMTRNLVRWVALHLPMQWPQGVQAPKGFDQVAGEGTQPTEFESDRGQLIALHKRFGALPDLPPVSSHPIFGKLSREEWQVWAYRHADHHLRQFGA